MRASSVRLRVMHALGLRSLNATAVFIMDISLLGLPQADVAVSFPGLGYDGPADVAVAMFTFPDEESYRLYRDKVATDPECLSAATLVRETECFTRYERLFLQPVSGA